MADLLILEPDERLNRGMCRVLEKVGHACLSARTISDGEALLRAGRHMTTVLNARLPWSESLAFLKALEDKGLPVLFLVTDSASEEHLRHMYQSSCAVLVTPFSGAELVNAVNRLLREADRTISLGSLVMDVEHRRVRRDGEELALTAQEFELLRALMQSPNEPVSRQQLLRDAWGYQSEGITRTVDVHVQRLRRKLGASCIETVYKLGYRLRA